MTDALTTLAEITPPCDTCPTAAYYAFRNQCGCVHLFCITHAYQYSWGQIDTPDFMCLTCFTTTHQVITERVQEAGPIAW